MADFATEGGHWYTQDGTPAYEVQARNGTMRATTLADARKLNLVPSVTTIMQCAAAPALENWKREQLLHAALTLPRIEGEELDEFAKRVVLDSQEQAKQARDLGTEIHGAIERAMFDTVWIPRPEAVAAIKTLGEWCGLDGFHSEKSFAHPLGFGGKVDVHKAGFVTDFKTKDFGPEQLPSIYDNHSWQLAAYRHGIKMPGARCAILYVSTRVPGLTHLVEVEQDELERGWEMFKLLLQFWKLKNRYDPQT